MVVWLEKSDQMSYRRARSAMIELVKSALDEGGFTIPFPIRTLDFGADVVGGQSVRLGAIGHEMSEESDAVAE